MSVKDLRILSVKDQYCDREGLWSQGSEKHAPWRCLCDHHISKILALSIWEVRLDKHFNSVRWFQVYGIRWSWLYFRMNEGGWLFSHTSWPPCDREVVSLSIYSLLQRLINYWHDTGWVGIRTWLGLKLANSSRSCRWVCCSAITVCMSYVSSSTWA